MSHSIVPSTEWRTSGGCIVVCWPPTRPNMPFRRRRKCIFHWRGRFGWQYGTWLKSHGTVINWCTGRECPVNCMTVISARWRSNMPFQRRRKCIFRWPVMGRYWVGVELLYNSVHRKFNEFGDQKSWRNDDVEKIAPSSELGPQASGWATLENEKDTTLMAIRVGVNMLQFCLVSNSLSHTTLSNKVRGIFFLRTVSLVFIVSSLWFCIHLQCACMYMNIQQYSGASLNIFRSSLRLKGCRS